MPAKTAAGIRRCSRCDNKMSPKKSQPVDEPGDETGPPDLPPGYVSLTPRPRRQPRPSTVPGWVKFVGFVVLLAAVVGGIIYAAQPPDQRESAKGTAELTAE